MRNLLSSTPRFRDRAGGSDDRNIVAVCRSILALIACLLWALPAAADELPAFSWRDEQGRTLTLADFAGKVVLVDFWASWCAPCVQEIPALARLHHEFAGQGLAVVPISIDKSGLLKVQAFYRRQGITNLPAYMDDAHAAVAALGITTIPVSWLIGRDGKVITRFDGAHDWEADKALIREALAR